MWKIAIIPVFGILVLWAWQFFNWVWVKPRKTEKLFRKQGMKGRNYSFIWSGPRPRVFVMDPDVIREVMTKYHTYHKSYKTSNEIAKMVVTGLINKEGEEWAKARMKLNPAFHLEKLKLKQTFLQLSELAFMGKLATNPLTLPGEKYFPTKKNRRAKEIDKYVRASFTSMINQRLEKRKAGVKRANQDLLDLFMQELYEGENLNDGDRQRIIDDIIGQCKLFFFAGYETNSNLLTWTMIMLSAHQDWQARAREEAVQVLGNKKEITSEDLGKLKIATMILNEMLRLFPSSMEFTRLVEEETTLDAGEFNPERFAEGIVKATKGENVYMPFGWGPRICIAQNFAFLESKTFLAMLLLNFTFELSPTYVHAPFVDFTIHPQYGAPIVLKKL
ncbi:hypothetical protein DH2020_027536 [Rehmannia glutinosa]|uniref:Uncharacterized protein n=1 Tax=Rehmannia glutinosa TaxID=99300 RepID=A0ABR0VXR4_REHGL